MKKRVTELEEEVKKYKDELDKALKRASAQPEDEVCMNMFLTLEAVPHQWVALGPRLKKKKNSTQKTNLKLNALEHAKLRHF